MPNPNPVRTREFEEQIGKGRPKGSRNRKTVERERAYQLGYQAALNDLVFRPQEVLNGQRKTDSKGSLGGSFRDLTQNPGIAMITSLFGPGALVVSGIAAQWIAEETVKLPRTTVDDQGFLDH